MRSFANSGQPMSFAQGGFLSQCRAKKTLNTSEVGPQTLQNVNVFISKKPATGNSTTNEPKPWHSWQLRVMNPLVAGRSQGSVYD